MQSGENGRYPRRRRRGYRKVRLRPGRLLLCVLLLASLTVLAVLLVSYAVRRNDYDALRAQVLSTPTPVVVTPPAAAAAQQGQESLPTPSPTPELSLSVDWRALKKTNHYVRAWLYCEGTNLNYPVVQYRDNEYFLGRNFEREKNDAGTLFFDCENVLSNGLENWIIYGHRRNDKSMFGALARYAKEDYYRTHPVMYLLTEEQTYRVEVFACRTVHAYPEYFTLWFQDERAFGKYIDKAIEHSYWKPEFAVGTEYPILTLATCSTYGNDSDPRLLVHGRLVPID